MTPRTPPLLLLLAACSPSSTPTALDTPTCGAPGPAHILPAPEGEPIRAIGRAGERYVIAIGMGAVGVDGARITTVGECGEDPQVLPEAEEVHIDGVRLWVVQGERVGHWPAAGGAVSWESEAGIPAGLVPGRGFVVVDPAARQAELLPGDGTRRAILSDVSIYPDFEYERVERFAAAGNVAGFLDDGGTLHVVDIEDPMNVHVVDDVASFALGPEGSWFITREGPLPIDIQQARGLGPVTFHARGTAETMALGRASAHAGVVNPTGWVRLNRELDGYEYLVVSTREIVAAPAVTLDDTLDADAGALYTTQDGAIVRWDPVSKNLEEKGEHPEGSRLHLVNEDGALTYRDSAAPTPIGIENAEIVIVPFDGSAPWTLPERADGAWLLPGPAAIYTPTVTSEPVEVRALLWVDDEGQPREIEARASISTALALDYDSLAHDLTFRVEDGERSGLWRAKLP